MQHVSDARKMQHFSSAGKIKPVPEKTGNTYHKPVFLVVKIQLTSRPLLVTRAASGLA